MLTKRIIPCLDVNAGRVVKGVNFVNLMDAGDPVEVAKIYDAEGADELVFLDITCEGETLAAGDQFGSIEAVKTVADALMPVSGKVIEINPDLESAPESVNKDPYGAGWLIKVEMTNPSEVDALLDAAAYEGICK